MLLSVQKSNFHFLEFAMEQKQKQINNILPYYAGLSRNYNFTITPLCSHLLVVFITVKGMYHFLLHLRCTSFEESIAHLKNPWLNCDTAQK